MNTKQAVKHFTLISMMVVGVSACSSSPEVEEQPAPTPVVVEQPIIEEAETVSTITNNGAIDIPILDDAQVFAEFSDSLPAVINYFTNATEDEIIDFYYNAFGEAHSQDRKRGRLTIKYNEGVEAVRVVISQQNKKRQVDIIVEDKH